MQDQTELDEPIKVQWLPGKLRSRIHERAWDSGATQDGDDWVPDYDRGEGRAAHVYAALSRQKTNIVIETFEEVEAVYNELAYYQNGAGKAGITWMNGSMQSSVERVRGEICEALRERGIDWERQGYGQIEL